MIEPYFLSILIFSPLVGMLIVAITPKTLTSTVKWVGFLATLLPLALAAIAYARFDRSVDFLQYVTSVPWIQIAVDPLTGQRLEIDYALGIDGLSLTLILLTTVISTLAAAASVNIDKAVKGYFLLFLLLEVGMLGVFCAQNLILFFAFFEMTLVPTYFLIAKWGLAKRENAAFTFLLYNGAGSAVMLIAFIILFSTTGTLNIAELQALDLASLGSGNPLAQPGFRMALVAAIIAAFAVKLPIFPLHSWMLRVHAEAPVPTVMIHSGILLKIGAYGLIRFALGLFPHEFAELSVALAVFGLINLLYGALIAFKQTDFRMVLAYSSVSHMGIVLLGLAALNAAGVQGAVFQVISHGLISALLFFLVGAIYARTGTTEIRYISGLSSSAPRIGGFLLAGGLASLGLPGMSGFISEFTAFLGLFEQKPLLAAIGTIGIILTAVYMLRAVMNMTFGKASFKNIGDLRPVEWGPSVVLLAFILWIGVNPAVISEPLHAVVDSVLVALGGS
ncbi:MAG TPA: NADH-quinone oxidoreductase subunit M [Bacillales bacterium]|nr:NADH-quinone oxidoreductase subunit M [Bacillales bacterium]